MEFFKSQIIPGEVFVQLIAFVIVFWTLKLLAWKPLLRALESRRERIRTQFEELEAAKGDIEKLKAEYQTHLTKIEEEARARLQEAVEEGRRIARQIQDKAREDSQLTLEKAKESLEIEVAKARITLRREIADLAIAVSEKILKEKMTDAKQQEKIMELIEELDKA